MSGHLLVDLHLVGFMLDRVTIAGEIFHPKVVGLDDDNIRYSSFQLSREANYQRIGGHLLHIDPVYQAVRGPIGGSVDAEILSEQTGHV